MRRLLACVLAAACSGGALGGALQAESDNARWRVTAEGLSITVHEHGVRVKSLAAASRDGRERSAITAIHYLPQRRSFVVAFETLPELWELSIDPAAAPIYDGLVHDYRMGEAIAEPGFLHPRRTRLETPLQELAVDDSGAYVLGRSVQARPQEVILYLVQLDVRRTIGRFAVGADPELAAATTLDTATGRLLRVPDRRGGPPVLVDLRRSRLLDGDAAGGAAR
jgi:hypothetical protein